MQVQEEKRKETVEQAQTAAPPAAPTHFAGLVMAMGIGIAAVVGITVVALIVGF